MKQTVHLELAVIADGLHRRVCSCSDQGFVDLAAAASAYQIGDPATFRDLAGVLSGSTSTFEVAEEVTRRAVSDGRTIDPATVRLRAPFGAVNKLICVAGNYRAHMNETGQVFDADAPRIPKFFLKPSTAISNPGSDIVVNPEFVERLDYEGEIGVVVGREAKNIAIDKVEDVIAGYTAVNDLSARQLALPSPELRGKWAEFFDWLTGKSLDGFGPLGPAIRIATLAEIENCTISTRVNGELRQQGAANQMIIGVRELVSWASRIMTLLPGDVIATGTPEGVGKARGQYLHDQDVVSVEVSGIGELTSRIVMVAQQ